MANAATVYNTIVGIVPTGSATAPTWSTTAQQLITEQAYCNKRALVMGAPGTGQNKLKSYMSTAKIRSVSKTAVMTEDNYRGSSAANPTNTWYWTIFNYQPGNGNQSLLQDIIITYYCVFEIRGVPAV